MSPIWSSGSEPEIATETQPSLSVAVAAPVKLQRYAAWSIAAALTTMALKGFAAWLTGSVSLFSDALESLVNLAGAAFAYWMLTVGATPPDEQHAHGHEKAEYFSSGFVGLLILVAGVSIIWAAVSRLIVPMPLEPLGVGLLVSALATAVNFGMSRVLVAAGRKHQSIALEADGAHLMTDVWTSAGVLAGLGLVAVTGFEWLDPVIAIVVALQILLTGYRLISRSADGLMDSAIEGDSLAAVTAALNRETAPVGAEWHALRTRVAGNRTFVTLHVLVPGDWSVHRGHELCEVIEAGVRALLPRATIVIHLEPLEDPRAYVDQHLND